MIHPSVPSAPCWTPPSARLRRALLGLLALSFALNVAAIFVPFAEIRVGLSSDPFSLPRTVARLWEDELYGLASLVTVFSICFPFVKLAVLAASLAGYGAVDGRVRAVRIVSALGKWSMLDVFIIGWILTLLTDRVFASAEPLLGIPLFMTAVLISMAVNEIMERQLVAKEAAPRKPRVSRFQRMALLAGHLGALVALVCAYLIPTLWIDDWLFADEPMSIVGSMLALWRGGAWSLAAAGAVFLIAAPLAAEVLTVGGAIAAARGRARPAWDRTAQVLRRWAMLDVFALASVVLLIEGGSLISTDLGWGAAALGIALGSYLPLAYLPVWLAHRE